MQTEWEAKFLEIDKEEVRKRLREAGGVLVKGEILYRRVVFSPPGQQTTQGIWLRVRDEGDKVTMSLKSVTNGVMESQKEVMVVVDNFDMAVSFLTSLGCKRKAYQETKREVWKVGKVEVDIDEWPYLEPYLEIEGDSKEDVKEVAEKLGFDYSSAVFGSADQVISRKYGIPEDAVNNEIESIVFSEPNPYEVWKKGNKRI